MSKVIMGNRDFKVPWLELNVFQRVERNSTNFLLPSCSTSWTSIKQRQILTTHNTNRHCRVRFYTFVGQLLSKQLYTHPSFDMTSPWACAKMSAALPLPSAMTTGTAGVLVTDSNIVRIVFGPPSRTSRTTGIPCDLPERRENLDLNVSLTLAEIFFGRFALFSSSETQGILAGTMWYFSAYVIFGAKVYFKSWRALGIYS